MSGGKREKITKPATDAANYVEKFIESDYFDEQAKKLRKEFDIPDGGFVYDIDEFHNYTQHQYYSPPEWKHYQDVSKIIQLNNIIQETFRDKFQLQIFRWIDTFLIYIFHNEIIVHDIKLIRALNDNVCKLVDGPVEFDDYMAEDPEAYPLYIKHRKHMAEAYPITLHISPSASQRKIVEFVRENDTSIKRLQEKYKQDTQLGKVKAKTEKLMEIKRFAYKYRDMNKKELMGKVNDKFKAGLGYEDLATLINDYKKYRKKV